jgi:hypothetical protein
MNLCFRNSLYLTSSLTLSLTLSLTISLTLSLASTGSGNHNEEEASLDAVVGVRRGKSRWGIRDGDGLVDGIGDWVRL